MREDFDDVVDNLSEPQAWLRILFMVGFALVLYLIVAPIVAILMVVQALFTVTTGDSHDKLRRFGQTISVYVYQVLGFLTYNREEKPFPFSDPPELGASPEPTASGDRNTLAEES